MQLGNNFCVTGNKEAASVAGMRSHGVQNLPGLAADAPVPVRQHPHRRLQSRRTARQHSSAPAHREWRGASQVLNLTSKKNPNLPHCRYRALPTELDPGEVEPYRLALRWRNKQPKSINCKYFCYCLFCFWWLMLSWSEKLQLLMLLLLFFLCKRV